MRKEGYYWVRVRIGDGQEIDIARWDGKSWWFSEQFSGPYDQNQNGEGWIIAISKRLDPPPNMEAEQ